MLATRAATHYPTLRVVAFGSVLDNVGECSL